MTHLDEARLLALRDGHPEADADGRMHLAECHPCQVVLERLENRSAAIAGALASLDIRHDLESARARVRQRLSGGTETAASPDVIPLPTRPRRRWGVELSRAAAVILVTATAAAAALPGSPVRDWLRGLASSDEPETAAGAPTPAGATPSAVEETAGVRLPVPAGPLRISLTGLSAGSQVRVRWVPGTEAAVFAPVGSRFTSAEGRIEASVSERGLVRVELPRSVVPVSLEVNGRIYLTSGADGLEVAGPATERGPEEIVFHIPGG